MSVEATTDSASDDSGPAPGRHPSMSGTAAYDQLAAADAVLGGLLARLGPADPFRWPGAAPAGSDSFAALVLHITSQQISTGAALSIFGRLEAATGTPPTAEAILRLGPDELRRCGLSGAKTASLLDLSLREVEERLDVDGLGGLEDGPVVAALTAVKGIGPWTAQMFLIHQLRRPDVLPAGDLGIRHAVRLAWSLNALPSAEAVQARGAAWSPYRTFASSLLWRSLGGIARPPRRAAGTGERGETAEAAP